MSLAKLQKQLLRDVKKSPGKAGALGLLLIVAVYFWAPLVVGFFARPTNKATSKTAAATNPQAAPAPGSAAGTPDAAPKHPWRQLAAWLEQDPRMQPVELPLDREPFQEVTRAASEERLEAPTAGHRLRSPESLGLVLSSTLAGGTGGVAVINGRPYRQGSLVSAGDNVDFVVARVGARHVILEYQGMQFELSIPKDDVPGGGGR